MPSQAIQTAAQVVQPDGQGHVISAIEALSHLQGRVEMLERLLVTSNAIETEAQVVQSRSQVLVIGLVQTLAYRQYLLEVRKRFPIPTEVLETARPIYQARGNLGWIPYLPPQVDCSGMVRQGFIVSSQVLQTRGHRSRSSGRGFGLVIFVLPSYFQRVGELRERLLRSIKALETVAQVHQCDRNSPMSVPEQADVDF